MSNWVRLKLPSNVSDFQINALNELIASHQNLEEFVHFVSIRDNMYWLADINANPMSPQAQLKPKNCDLSMQQLTRMFPTQTELGVAELDLNFERTPSDVAWELLSLLVELRDYPRPIPFSDKLYPSVVEVEGDIDKLIEIANRHLQTPPDFDVFLEMNENRYSQTPIV